MKIPPCVGHAFQEENYVNTFIVIDDTRHSHTIYADRYEIKWDGFIANFYTGDDVVASIRNFLSVTKTRF